MFLLLRKNALILSGGLFCLLMVRAERSDASHAAGGEITYEWVRDSTYRFYFKFYRACSGIAEPSTTALCYYNSCNNDKGSITLSKIAFLPDGSPNGGEVSPGCPGYATNCNGGNAFPGYREWWYTGLVTLSSRCDNWIFYVMISSRNASTNISSGNLYIEATMDNRNVANNSSPYFSVKPVPYVCVNNPYVYNNGAIDPNNDSLAFEFINPRTLTTACSAPAPPLNIAFSGSYNLTNPFATNNTFRFDAATGSIDFTASAISTNTVTFRVSEYRNGRKIGSVMRDVQIGVLACNAVVPSVTVIPGSLSGSVLAGGRIEGVANRPLSFCYDISAPGSGIKLVTIDNHTVAAPGSAVSYNGQAGNPVTGCFSWIPSCADTGLKIFTVTVKDTTCAPPGITMAQTFTIPLYIRSQVVTSKTVYICRGDSVSLAASGGVSANWSVMPGGDGTGSLSCTGCAVTVARPQLATTYVARADYSGCSNTDYFDLRIDNDLNKVTIVPDDPYLMCRPGYVDLNVQTTGPKPFFNLSCSAVPVAPNTPSDTVAVAPGQAVLQRTPNPVSSPFSGGAALTSRHQYLLRASDLRASGMYSGTLSGLSFYVSPSGGAAVYESFSIALKCTDRNGMDYTGGFEQGAIPVYTASAPLTIPASGGYVRFDFAMLYNWDTTQNLIVDICYTNTTPTNPAYTHYYNSSYQSTLYGNAATGSMCSGLPGSPVFSTHELPAVTFYYYEAPESSFSYRWENGIFVPSAVSQAPRLYAGSSSTIYVWTRSRHGCLLGDSLQIKLSEGFELTPRDTAVCLGESFRLRASRADHYRWYEQGVSDPSSLTCYDCPDPVARPAHDIVYMVAASDSLGCTDTLEATVRVISPPEVRIAPRDTMIGYGRSLQLHATGADRYAWQPSEGLDDPGTDNPVATIMRPIVYTVRGDKDICYGYDSIRISVDYQEEVPFIPSVFSPNGDGKNDLFRIGNMNVHRLQEFRVFNRFGQEVFSTTDPLNGWDGTYRGVPQAIGVYQYLIRIANPDGTAEALKGDVTLVR